MVPYPAFRSSLERKAGVFYPVCMEPTPEQVAYAAGLFEGEGSIDRSKHASGKYVYPRLQIAMVDREPLDRFQSIMGGRLHGPYKHRRRKGSQKWKVYWKWSVNGWADFDRVMILMRPWLSPRRLAQADAVWAVRPPLRVETPECGLPPSNRSIYQHRKRKEKPCRACREWGNANSRPNAKTRRTPLYSAK